ncbi:hypothetical protein QP794_17085 [Paenibacillus sp. UMB7766-LJ446]|uniref:hypothetical protein n=1 Tax=Paenibacillus sp. UMB7766-LJ446 TaxID=3046313 RepID=UPI0025506723|nr:hypothetical protein [Paenibacillus sp. UMB7766-LJ446]MDK8191806.1 hypothetical protein [Paenibacillus sp. UMB7766-LJ446]
MDQEKTELERPEDPEVKLKCLEAESENAKKALTDVKEKFTLYLVAIIISIEA